MADEFVMPKLGLTMESGTIVNWLVDDGDEVAPGQPLLVIETDKVESEVEATGAGVIHRTGAVGEEYLCGQTIGWLLAPGEEPPAAVAAAAAGTATVAAGSAGAGSAAVVTAPARAGGAGNGSAAVTGPPAAAVAATGAGGRLLASPNAKRLAALRGIDLWSIAGSGPGGRITSEDVPDAPPTPAAPAPVSASAPATAPPPATVGRLATAAARNLADLLGVDIGAVAPTGPDPRVTKEDVAAHVRALLAPAAPPAATPPAPASRPAELPAAQQEPSSVIPMRGMRRTIAERMSRSIHEMAQLTLTMDVDMDAVVADRDRRRDAGGDAVVPGYTDYVIAATAAALVEHPYANSQVVDGGVALLPQVNVGLAVALDDGLIVPVVHDTPSLDLAALAAETSRLAAAARDGGLTLPELEGGTFAVTALGMYGVDAFTPIINAPNTAILGVGRLRDDVAWADDGSPTRAARLTLSLTWDHRAFDGAPAAAFTRAIKAGLEAW